MFVSKQVQVKQEDVASTTAEKENNVNTEQWASNTATTNKKTKKTNPIEEIRGKWKFKDCAFGYSFVMEQSEFILFLCV